MRPISMNRVTFLASHSVLFFIPQQKVTHRHVHCSTDVFSNSLCLSMRPLILLLFSCHSSALSLSLSLSHSVPATAERAFILSRQVWGACFFNTRPLVFALAPGYDTHVLAGESIKTCAPSSVSCHSSTSVKDDSFKVQSPCNIWDA